MKLIHTADWHLGRALHGANLIEDQAYLLDQFVDLVRQEQPDAVLIAGDVYDRAVPPGDAVDLLDETLCRLAQDCGTQVVVIAGNHDSPTRLNFASRMLRSCGVHILGVPTCSPQPVTLADDHGPIHVYPLPYAEPAVIRHQADLPDLRGHSEAMVHLMQGIRAGHQENQRAIAVAHCFVGGGQESESERPLSVGGAGAIDPAVFDGFDYVALGHLHRPQSFNGGAVRFSGSLMRYSFSEAKQNKSVSIVEIDAAGSADIREIKLTPRRQVRCIEGLLTDVLAGADKDPGREDYLMVTLTDTEHIFDAMGKLREVYPNVLHLDRAGLRLANASDTPNRADPRKDTELDLFKGFLEEVTGREPDEAQLDAFSDVADGARAEQREATS
ncbi:MAG: exonuclease SbcCD subunit D [Phycisphaerae bacterium]